MTTTSTEQLNQRLIGDWARLCSSHDLDGLMQILTDDVVYEDVALGELKRGKDAVRAFAGEFFSRIPDVTLELASNFATPTQGGAEWVMRGTQTGSFVQARDGDKRFELRGASILEFANGRICRVSDYWDKANFREQVA
jgi:steroid delta-isomerase-like uncharacterized protein